MGASAIVFPGISDLSILETLACREALALAEDLGNASVVKEINEHSRIFDSVRFIHEGRQHISEAHNLACAAISFDPGRHLWLLNPPNIVPVQLFVVNIIG
jgi:hypothetical protein